MHKLLVLLVCVVTFVVSAKLNSVDYDITLEEVEYKNNAFLPLHIQVKETLPIPEEDIKELVEFAKSGDISPRGISANINEYCDKVFPNIDQFMIHNGFDPFQMPDAATGFNFTFLFIRYHGEIELTKGWLSDISTIHRDFDRDCLVEYSTEDRKLTVSVPIAFNDMMFTYDYSAKLMNLGPTGGIEGKVTNVRVDVTIGFDTANYTASLDYFNIVNTGHIDFKFTGNILIDWIFNILSEVVTTLLKGIILGIVESIIKGVLTSIVNLVNDVIGSIINTTQAATTTPAATVNVAKFMIGSY